MNLFDIRKPSNQLAAFLLLFVVGFIIVTCLQFVTLVAFNILPTELIQHASALRITNSISQIFLLFLPAFLISFWLKKANGEDYLEFNNTPSFKNLSLVLIFSLVSIPIMSFIITLNESMRLPECLHSLEQWMQTQENLNNEITETMIKQTSTYSLIMNILALALCPAICEEVLFRGLLMKWLYKVSHAKHLSVWLSAIIFSSIHLQFYGFFPRMLLGAAFGYIFLFTKSIWVNIFAHFCNNAMAIFAAFLYFSHYSQTHYSKIGNFDNAWYALLISFILTTITFIFIYKSNKNNIKI